MGGGGVGCYIRSQAPARRKNAWPEPSIDVSVSHVCGGGGGGVGCYIRSQAPARRKNAWPEPSNFKNRDEIDTSTKQLIRQFNSEVANLTGGGECIRKWKVHSHRHLHTA